MATIPADPIRCVTCDEMVGPVAELTYIHLRPRIGGYDHEARPRLVQPMDLDLGDIEFDDEPDPDDDEPDLWADADYARDASK